MKFCISILVLLCIGCGCPRVKPQPLPNLPVPPIGDFK